MGRHTKHRNSACPKCQLRIRVGRLYVIHPETGVPYHADCYRQEADG